MTIIRWLLVVPGAILASILGSLAGGIVFTIFHNQTLMDTGSALLGSFVLAFVAGLIAPSKQSKTTLIFSCIIIFLALLSFVLSVATNVDGFADRSALGKILIPVAEILGALYAVFLLPLIIIPRATLEDIWGKIHALGIVVASFGILISLVGLLVGLLGQTWVGLITGLCIIAVGTITHLFPFIHLYFRLRRLEAKVNQAAYANMVGKRIPWKSIKGNLFTVIKFTPNAYVRGNTVKANSAFEPYAMLTVESPSYDTHILVPVIHSLDFLNLWRIFNEHIVESDKEVIVTYDPDKWFGKIMPHLPIMIAPKNTVKRIANISSLPTSEKCAIVDSIIRYWDPPHPGRDLHATISLWRC